MAETDVKRTLVQLDIDQAASKRVQAGTQQVKKHLEEMRAEIRALGREFGTTDDRLAKYGKVAKRVGREIDDLQAELDGAEKAVKKLDKTMASADGADQYAANIKAAREQSELYGDTDSRLAAIGSFARTAGAGGVADVLGGASDFLGAVEGVKRLKAELPALANQMGLTSISVGKLTLALGAAAAVAAGMAVVTKSLADEGERARREQEAFLDTQRQLTELDVGALTTKEIEEETTAREELIEGYKREQEAIKDQYNAQLGSMDGWDRAVEKFSQVAGWIPLVGGEFSNMEKGLVPLKNRYDELGQSITAQEGVLVELDKAAGSTTTALNDLKVATDEWRNSIIERIDQEYAAEKKQLELSRQAGGLSVEQLKDRIALEKENIALNYKYAEIATENMNFDQQEMFLDLVAEGELRLDIYNAALRRAQAEEALLAGHLEDEARVAKALGDIHADATGKFEASKVAAEAAAEAAEKYAQTLAKRELQLTQDAEKWNLDRTRELADHYAEMAELDRDYYAERGDIIREMQTDLAAVDQDRADELADLNKDLQGLASDHAKNMRRIARDAERDEQKAARELNAIALADAQQAREDALEDENEQYRDERDEQEQQYRERLQLLSREQRETLDHYRQSLNDLDAQHRQERAANEAAFREELRRADQDRQIKLQHQQQQWNLEDQQRGVHNSRILATTAGHYASLESITQTSLAAVESKFASAMSRIASKSISASSSQQSKLAALTSKPVKYAVYDDGGYPSVGQDVVVGGEGPEIARFMSPVRIYPNGTTPPARAGGIGNIEKGAIQIIIQDSTSPELTARAVDRRIEQKLEQYWS